MSVSSKGKAPVDVAVPLPPPPQYTSVPQTLPRYATLVDSPWIREDDATLDDPDSLYLPTTAEHMFSLGSSKGSPWATLILGSFASSPKHPPKYFDGCRVAYCLRLKLDSPEKFQTITLTVGWPF
jgi:hypothetical protein